MLFLHPSAYMSLVGLGWGGGEGGWGPQGSCMQKILVHAQHTFECTTLVWMHRNQAWDPRHPPTLPKSKWNGRNEKTPIGKTKSRRTPVVVGQGSLVFWPQGGWRKSCFRNTTNSRDSRCPSNLFLFQGGWMEHTHTHIPDKQIKFQILQ